MSLLCCALQLVLQWVEPSFIPNQAGHSWRDMHQLYMANSNWQYYPKQKLTVVVWVQPRPQALPLPLLYMRVVKNVRRGEEPGRLQSCVRTVCPHSCVWTLRILHAMWIHCPHTWLTPPRLSPPNVSFYICNCARVRVKYKGRGRAWGWV